LLLKQALQFLKLLKLLELLNLVLVLQLLLLMLELLVLQLCLLSVRLNFLSQPMDDHILPGEVIAQHSYFVLQQRAFPQNLREEHTLAHVLLL